MVQGCPPLGMDSLTWSGIGGHEAGKRDSGLPGFAPEGTKVVWAIRLPPA